MAQPAAKKQSNTAKSQPSKNSSLKATIRDQSGAGKKRIGELLSKEGYITSTQLDEALKYQDKNDGRLGSILVKLGYIDEETIVNVLNRFFQSFPAESRPQDIMARENLSPGLLEYIQIQSLAERAYQLLDIYTGSRRQLIVK